MYALLLPPRQEAPSTGDCSAGALVEKSVSSSTDKKGSRREKADASAAPVVELQSSPAQKRLSFLFQASVHLACVLPSLSRLLQDQMREVARRHVVRLHASVKHAACRRCCSVLLPLLAKVRRPLCCQGGACCCRRCGGLHSETPFTSTALAADPGRARGREVGDSSATGPQIQCEGGEERDRPSRRRRRARRQVAQGSVVLEGKKRVLASPIAGSAFRAKKGAAPLTEIECLVCGLLMRRP